MNLVVSFLAVAVTVVDCLAATTGLESTGGARGVAVGTGPRRHRDSSEVIWCWVLWFG